ncbi:histone deacetylase 6-like isoform X2 [Oscarella lobularis]|uniref:histone deacetylase 6-like isoform X2 n=1 Tax=Oscarella lobularis TaxID=121494 RepID=UPI003313BCF1
MVEEVVSRLDDLAVDDRRGSRWATGLVYDELMTRHENTLNPWHPETPERIRRIWQALEESGCVRQCTRLPIRRASTEEIALQHQAFHIEDMKATAKMSEAKLQQLGDKYDSVYLNKFSYDCALLSLGGTLALTQAVLDNEVLNGMAVVRPPGHHAEQHCCAGFCLFNNIAIAAKWAKENRGVKKILIVDWDVHHGNGIQHMFESDPTVLYFSTHRYDYGRFYPGSPDANYDQIGKRKGTGFNINVPWNTAQMGDGDYLAAFSHILMPVAREFSPDLVFVSCGFDAAVEDPLGRCCVTPDGYAHMMHQLMSLTNGRVVVMLEGGYNLSSISQSAVACVKILLGNNPPKMDPVFPCPSALESIRNAMDAHAPYWKGLNVRGSVTSATADPDVSEDGAGAVASGGSSDDSKTTIAELLKNITSDDDATLYAIQPLAWCPHLPEVAPVPRQGINVKDPCTVCGDVIENWICLRCYKVMCSRYANEHMIKHSSDEDHHVVLSFSDLSVWCYACDNYVDNEMIRAAKQSAHQSKFGEEMPF